MANLPSFNELEEAIRTRDRQKVLDLSGVSINDPDVWPDLEEPTTFECTYCDESVDQPGMLCRRHQEESDMWEAGDSAYHDSFED